MTATDKRLRSEKTASSYNAVQPALVPCILIHYLLVRAVIMQNTLSKEYITASIRIV
nr:MAG TPA: hypothetical protein [Caudoviricetes sp.]